MINIMLLLTAATLVSKTLLGPVQNQAKSSTMISLVHNNEIISKGYKMIVFDKDGTLGDCFPSMQKWCERMTECIIKDYNNSNDTNDVEHKSKLKFTVDKFHHAIGWNNTNQSLYPSSMLSAGSWSDILEVTWDSLIQAETIANAEEKVNYWHENLGEIHGDDKPLIPDLKGFMKSLKDSGYLVSICTSDDRKSTDSCIQSWDLESCIDFSICGDEVLESKPSSFPLLELCKIANVNPEECVVVGDTSADTGMAQNGNAAFIVGVLTGSGTTESLLETGAHVVLPDISYLREHI